MAKRELLATLRDRYRSSSKKDKSRILGEFIAVTGHHRNHGLRLFRQLEYDEDAPCPTRGRRIYDDAVTEAVIVIGEAADQHLLWAFVGFAPLVALIWVNTNHRCVKPRSTSH